MGSYFSLQSNNSSFHPEGMGSLNLDENLQLFVAVGSEEISQVFSKMINCRSHSWGVLEGLWDGWAMAGVGWPAATEGCLGQTDARSCASCNSSSLCARRQIQMTGESSESHTTPAVAHFTDEETEPQRKEEKKAGLLR